MLIEWMTPDFIFNNENGSLKQLVRDGWRQVNVITSIPGSVRGGHYHKFNREAFYVIKGSFRLTLWQDKKNETFSIPSNVFHSFDYQEETILVSMYSRGVELSETEKDIWTK